MEVWNRDELYAAVWEEPLIRVAPKYGVSAVMIGKVCRKLKVPLPGRGYWARMQFGHPPKREPLPVAKDLPVIQRFKTTTSQPENPSSTGPEPSDAEYLRIIEFEARQIPVVPATKHKLTDKAEKAFKNARAADRGIPQHRYDQPCLDIRVTKTALERALAIVNNILLVLEAEGFPVRVEPGKHGTAAQIFGVNVPFAVTEKVREIGRREVKEYSWTKTIVDYEGTGLLEFRVGDYVYGHKSRDSKTRRLESMLTHCVGALMREGRARKIQAEDARIREIERQKKQAELWELSRQIDEEEKKVKDLNTWVDDWARARKVREFVAELEKVWAQEGNDLSPEAPKGQRIVWMKQQADRLDPMIPSPPSILDRKGELRGW